jgi:hypothetical protein
MLEVTAEARALVAAKSANPGHAMSQGAEQHRAEQHGTALAQGARKPLRDDDADDDERQDDDAEKSSQRHPANGRFVSDQTTFGAAHGPLAAAMAMHRPASALATLQAAGAPSQAGSIESQRVEVQRLDYRTATGPLAVSGNPVRPPFHTASNQPTGDRS